MGRHDQKGIRFEFLVKRIDEALEAGFYVEALSLTYSLMEERTYKLLERLGIPWKSRDKLYQCLVYFQNHVSTGTISVTPIKCTQGELVDWLKENFLDSGLVGNIDKWRDDRNDVIHDLAKQDMDYNDLRKVAETGRNCFRTYTALIMKLKKMIGD